MFIKIDFEKAYDQIEWPSILAMLQALGFRPFFIQISICSLQMLLLKFLSTAFTRSPLVYSGLLGKVVLFVTVFYVLAAEGFGYLSAHAKAQGLVCGISLLDELNSQLLKLIKDKANNCNACIPFSWLLAPPFNGEKLNVTCNISFLCQTGLPILIGKFCGMVRFLNFLVFRLLFTLTRLIYDIMLFSG